MSSPLRTVRVYACSLFDDMKAERAYLHEAVFPQLRVPLEKQGIRLEVVDLRWGAASEDAAEGTDTLQRCFEEIDRCRPFFIGLLGERYGMPLDHIPEDAAREHPWLKENAGLSRLHLEVLHGVLRNPDQAPGSFFYFRKPDFLDQVPVAQRIEFPPECPEAEAKLQALRQAIRSSGRPVREFGCKWDAPRRQVSSLGELGGWLAEDLVRSLELPRQWKPLPSTKEKILAEINSLQGAIHLSTHGIFDSRKVLEVTEGKPPYVDENVQFTVYRPKAVQPQKWYPLLAFAHLSERRPDAPPDEPDPMEEVESQVKRVLGKQARDYQDVTQDSRQAVPRQGEITFVPEVEGIEFNPPRRSFRWEKSVHREEFDMRAAAELDGKTARGRLTVFLGGILLADIFLAVRVDSKARPPSPDEPQESTAGRPYRKIFASYSHKDLEIVKQFEHFARAIGDEYLRDWTHLRAGEVWNDRLLQMIEEADVFQLFWSSNSMRSGFVRQEWEHALSLQRPSFIRPTYWEDPMPASPQDNLPPAELQRLQFQRIFAEALTHPALQPAAPPAPGTVVFSPDGKTLASGGADQTARLWEVAPPAPAPPAREDGGLEPTRDEDRSISFDMPSEAAAGDSGEVDLGTTREGPPGLADSSPDLVGPPPPVAAGPRPDSGVDLGSTHPDLSLDEDDALIEESGSEGVGLEEEEASAPRRRLRAEAPALRYEEEFEEEAERYRGLPQAAPHRRSRSYTLMVWLMVLVNLLILGGVVWFLFLK